MINPESQILLNDILQQINAMQRFGVDERTYVFNDIEVDITIRRKQ